MFQGDLKSTFSAGVEYNSRTLNYDFNNLESPPAASVHSIAWNETPDEELGDDMSILIADLKMRTVK